MTKTYVLAALAMVAASAAVAQAPGGPMPAQDRGETMEHGRQSGRMMGPDMMDHDMMMGPGMMGPGMVRMMLIVVDTDGDGALSLEEVQAVHARMFKAADGDGNGRLTLEEIEGFMGGGAVAPTPE